MATIAGFITVGAAARPAEPFVPGYTFRISSAVRISVGNLPRNQDDEVMRGRGIAAQGRSRIEFLAYSPLPSNVTTNDYLIAADSGKVYIDHSASQTITPANDMFGGPAVVTLSRVLSGLGRGGGAADGGGGGGRGGFGGGGRRGGGGGGPGGRGRGRGGLGGLLNQVQILNVGFKLDKLGADTVDGHPAQHYRVTTDYRVVWGEQGFPAHAVTDLWTTALPVNIPNPFEPLAVADQSADGPLIEYALRMRAIRAQIEGVPVRVTTTTTLSDIKDVVGFQSLAGGEQPANSLTVMQTTQITNIQPGDVDPKLLKTPDDNPM
jgi:hypothetical protein